jgi:hypothetical protein
MQNGQRSDLVEFRHFILPDLLALALFAAVCRSSAAPPPLPGLRGVPWWLLVAALLVSGALAERGIKAMGVVDGELTKHGQPRGAKLEWVYRPTTAGEVIKGWKEASMLERVAEGLRLDTVSFIPFYPFSLFALALLAARAWPTDSVPYRWGIALAWGGLAAGVLDLLENAGIWLELRRGLIALAPMTATVALLKWILIALVAYYAIAAAIATWTARTPG